MVTKISESQANWTLGSIIYHIYVRSFKDSNNDGIGDLTGVIEKLDYLTSLGVNAIWLSPIYPSPQADFGYDVADYKDIDPVYGSLAVFDTLVHEAKKRGIRIMMDFVPNHTSVNHAWFQESKSSKTNPKRDWYVWRKGKDGKPPNNWLSVFGGSAWEYDPATDEYYLHTFEKNQPDLHWRNPKVASAMLSTLHFWMDRGVDGFRVDVPYHLFKNETYEDEPLNPNFIPGKMGMYESLLHVHTAWLPESFAMMKEFVSVLKEYDNKFMVTEAWGTMENLVHLYKTVGWKYYAPFNFSLITLPWKAEAQKEYIDAYEEALGDLYIPCFVLGNHDTSRVASRIGVDQARIAAMLVLTLRGLPFIYYGEEIGMTNGVIPHDKIQDPFEINSPGLGLGRDPQRTPMQWDSTSYAGFSQHEPWLPIGSKETSVATQENEPTSFFSLYKMLIKLRKHHPSLREGSYIPLASPAENVFAFLREYQHEKVLILLNMDENSKDVSFNFPTAHVLCNAFLDEPENKHIDLTSFRLRGNDGYIFSLS